MLAASIISDGVAVHARSAARGHETATRCSSWTCRRDSATPLAAQSASSSRTRLDGIARVLMTIRSTADGIGPEDLYIAIVLGATTGFLVYNFHPASMGCPISSRTAIDPASPAP